MNLKKFLPLLFASTLIFATSCNNSTDSLKSDFKNPPPSMTTGCYWYWLSDNISKEGAVNDLHAMKQAGINSAFIGNIGGQTALNGKVKIFSEEWWDVIHTVLKTAGELDIEIGMFNSPGWSQSGGPWIKPEQSMRYLVASETRISGTGKAGETTTIKLPLPSAASGMADWSDHFENNENVPAKDFQDVSVIAFPIPEDYGLNLFEFPGKHIETSPNIIEPRSKPEVKVRNRPEVSDSSNIALKYILPTGESSISLKLPETKTARSLIIYPAGLLLPDARLEAKIDGEFQTVKAFTINRRLPVLYVGHVPFAPSVVSFPETESDEFRIVFNNKSTHNNGAGKLILSPTPYLEDYPERTLAKLYQGDSPDWDYYHFPEQPSTDLQGLVPSANHVIDLTDRTSNGILKWEVPEGEWLILRTGMVPTYIKNSPATPEGTGLEMDKLSKTSIKHHFDSFIGEIMRRVPAKDRKTFRVMVEDSWEKAGQNFTDNFIEIFRSRYQYDATPYLPVLTGHIVGNADVSSRFLWDVRRLAAELTASENVKGLTEIANKHGLKSWLENYGDWGFPGEALLYGKYADMVGGEFWEDNKKPYIQIASSCAHIYNKPAVYAEAFTNGRDNYRHDPQTLKRFADEAFAEGMTRCVLHVYVHQAYEEMFPGIDAWFGVEFNRKNTWFDKLKVFTEYLKRCGLMLEQGQNVADIACFIGEDVPVNSGPFEMKNKEGKSIPELPEGYRYDYVNSDVILHGMKVKDGFLTLPHGLSYRVLLLPDRKTMRPEVLEKIREFAEAGAIIVGNPPESSPSLEGYPAADAKVKELSGSIWGHHPGVFRDTDLGEIFRRFDILPDFQSGCEDILFTHRTSRDRDIYFLSNRSDGVLRTDARFRVSDGIPELWNPVTGETRELPIFERVGGMTSVPLRFEGHESMFIVFDRTRQPSVVSDSTVTDNFPVYETVLEVTSPWSVAFDSDSIHRGPSGPVVLEELTDWSKSDEESIKYYSGRAVYRTVFGGISDVSGDSDVFLEFAGVRSMAEIKVNGRYAGTVWTPPYRVSIGDFLQEENVLEVEVVNNWVNRLMGDSFLPEEERVVVSPHVRYRADSLLQESGLIGGVRIVRALYSSD